MLDTLGWPGRLTCTERPRRRASTAPTSCSSSCASAARPRGSSTRRCRRGSASIGQETTGAGGFAKALRTVPVVLELAERDRPPRRRRAPGSSTSRTRSGSSPRRCSTTGHRAIGLCNVAIDLQRGIAARFGVEPERVELEHVGLNHLTWERAVRVDGVDRLPELLDAGRRRTSAEHVGLPGELVRALGAIPSYYLRYYYQTRQVVERAARPGTRGPRRSSTSRRELLEMYRDPDLAEKPALLGDRGGAFYSEAAAQLIASLHDGARRRPGRRRRATTGPSRTCPTMRWSRSRPGSTATAPIPSPLAAAGARDARARPGDQGLRGAGDRGGPERRPADRAAGAAGEPARRPTTTSAAPLLDALLEANRAYLPRFFS